MHVAHLMKSSGPFARDWAKAVENYCTVSRIGIGHQTHQEADTVVVPKGRLRPTRIAYPANDRIEAIGIAGACRRISAVSDEPIQLIHGHFLGGGRRLIHSGKRLGVPVAFTEHFSGLTDRAHTSKQLTDKAISRARWVYERADILIAVSDYLANMILSRTGIEADVVGNPVDVDLFSLGNPSELPQVVYVGRLHPDKRPDLLIQGFSLLRNRGVEARLTLVGDGPSRDYLHDLVDQLSLRECVHFTGKVPRHEVAKISQSASVGVSTSAVETFGVAVAEFSSVGLPVVAPDLPPFDEVLPVEGRLLFEPNSIESLVEALTVALARSWDRQAIRASIVARYSHRAIGRRLLDLYERVV